jgi:predicted nucleic acid-binding protein
MIVVDASVVLDAILETERSATIERRIFAKEETIVAPHLLDVEIAQVLRRFQASRQLAERRAEEAIADYLALPIERYPHLPLLGRVWDLRRNLTAYDAVYVALAEFLDVRLLTADKRIARYAPHVAELIQ